MPVVVRVRREPADDGSHRHIVGVLLREGGFRTIQQVIMGISRGEVWRTQGTGGASARIRQADCCPADHCELGPCLSTAPDHSAASNIDALRAC